MEKIVLLAINAKYVHSSLAVWYIAASIKARHGTQYDVSVIEANINQKIEDIACTVAALKPDIVGISSYIWNARKLPELLGQLRELLTDAVFVLGGPEAVYNAQFWRNNGADYVLKGQVDHSIDPYTDDYFKVNGDKLSYIEASRGCPFNCAFCLSADSNVEFFPLETVKERIYKLSQSRTKTIKFVDRTFNCNPGRAYEIFEYIIGLETHCKFHFEVAADLFDERTLSLIKTAPPGRLQFEIGLQSFFEPALKASSRTTDLQKAELNIKSLLKAQNCHIHVDLIAGLPYETLKDFHISFDRAYRLGAHTLQLGFLKLFHGTKLREQANSFEIVYNLNPPYEIQSSKWLNSDDLKVLKATENALQHTYNKCRFITTIEYVLEVSGILPFDFYHSLGSNYPSHKTQLEDYISQIYEFCNALPGVNNDILCDKLHYDWLSMVKGKNLPQFLKNRNTRRQISCVPLKSKVVASHGRTMSPESWSALANDSGDAVRPCGVTTFDFTTQRTCPHVFGRNEYAVLSNGKVIYVDSSSKNPVTGLYKINIECNQ